MKNRKRTVGAAIGLLALFLCCGVPVRAAGSGDIIKSGIYAENVDLSGKNAAEAQAAVEQYVNGLRNVEITLDAGGETVKVTAGELGISWANRDIIEDALDFGSRGNVIERYKQIKDLEHEPYVYDIALDFDVEAINDILVQKCMKYDQKAVNVSMRKNAAGEFEYIDGQEGRTLDVEASIDKIYETLTGDWDTRPCTISLAVAIQKPQGSVEELAQLTDVLGSFTTSYSTSSSSRCKNVENGCNLINGTLLYPGDEFSTYNTVAPFSKANGYYMAGSYMNGKVVDSLGGGICQVSTTLYNAVLEAELEVTERHNHSMIVTYVDPSADAAIAESAGKDFRFVNNLKYPIYIEGYTEGKKVTFNIYGVETRDAGHSVTYESKVIKEINPTTDNIYADAGRPIGYIVTSGAHTGYNAQLWKIVKENGKEVSREMVNSSNYKMSPRSATVGVATDDPNAYNEIMAAIGTGSIDHVRAVIGGLTAPAPQVVPEEDDDDDDD
ncbi:MAG: VanW family protein [Lachnospiraceae bacterium]|nr:VanW family protein [Lachnospiraceae bacterium]